MNADEIAKTLPIENEVQRVYRATEIAENIRQDYARSRRSFVMETVLSDEQGSKLDFLRYCQKQGYWVTLFAILLDNPQLSRLRVSTRVTLGGHDVPADKCHARYPRTLQNLSQAIRLVDETWILDNSSIDKPYQMVAQMRHGVILDQDASLFSRWQAALKLDEMDPSSPPDSEKS